MDIRKLQRAIVDGLEDVKAHDIVVFNTEHLSALFERVIIASGTSNRQTKALAASVRDAVKEGGFPVLRTEGEANGEWIIVDCGAAVTHIMQPDIRRYYHLEELWGGKAVKMKLGAAGGGLVKAAEPEEDVPAPRGAAKRAAGEAKAAAKAPRRASGKPAAAAQAAAKTAGRKAPSAARPAGRKPAAAPAGRKPAAVPAKAGRAAAGSAPVKPARAAGGSASAKTPRAAAGSATAKGRTATGSAPAKAGRSGAAAPPTRKSPGSRSAAKAPAKKGSRRA
jgi:ribosome-associated protein